MYNEIDVKGEKNMKLVIKHLKKNFEKKEVLKDINFEFEKRKNIRIIRKKWSW